MFRKAALRQAMGSGHEYDFVEAPNPSGPALGTYQGSEGTYPFLAFTYLLSLRIALAADALSTHACLNRTYLARYWQGLTECSLLRCWHKQADRQILLMDCRTSNLRVDAADHE